MLYEQQTFPPTKQGAQRRELPLASHSQDNLHASRESRRKSRPGRSLVLLPQYGNNGNDDLGGHGLETPTKKPTQALFRPMALNWASRTTDGHRKVDKLDRRIESDLRITSTEHYKETSAREMNPLCALDATATSSYADLERMTALGKRKREIDDGAQRTCPAWHHTQSIRSHRSGIKRGEKRSKTHMSIFRC